MIVISFIVGVLWRVWQIKKAVSVFFFHAEFVLYLWLCINVAKILQYPLLNFSPLTNTTKRQRSVLYRSWPLYILPDCLWAVDVTQIGFVYFGVGQSSSAGTATVKMPDTSKIKTTMSSILPLLFHRPPVCACGREGCCVCMDFQSVEATDGPVPYAWRQPSVSWRLVATAIRTLCGGSNLFHHR